MQETENTSLFEFLCNVKFKFGESVCEDVLPVEDWSGLLAELKEC